MLWVYVGPIAPLATALQGELANEHEFLAKLATHSAMRAQSLKAGRALLKYALQQQGLLARGERLPPMVISELGKPYLQWPRSGAEATSAATWEFNLSHAHSLIALSLGQGPMGIDIECCTRKHFHAALLNELMCSEERCICAALGRERATSIMAGAISSRAVNEGESLVPLSASQLQVAESELKALSPSPAWAHIAARECVAGMRQCLWWTQQWTVRECALKVLGKSIFAHEQIGWDLPQMQMHLAGMPQGAIHCYSLVTTNKIDAPLGLKGEADRGGKNNATSLYLRLPQSAPQAEYLLSIFVPRGEKLRLNLWFDDNWHETSLTASCVYQILST